MRPFAASIFVASVLFSFGVFGQSEFQVKYCRDLAASYRRAVTNGKSAVDGVTQAIVNCPTNPGDSISVLEAAHKAMKVELPPK
jgi:hypothetical protein